MTLFLTDTRDSSTAIKAQARLRTGAHAYGLDVPTRMTANRPALARRSAP